MKQYDYLIVGAGLYGAVMAYELGKKGRKCLVIDRRHHIAGNIYCEDVEGIHADRRIQKRLARHAHLYDDARRDGDKGHGEPRARPLPRHIREMAQHFPVVVGEWCLSHNPKVWTRCRIGRKSSPTA